MKLAEYKVTYIYSQFNNTRNLFVGFIRIQGNHFGKLEVQKNTVKKHSEFALFIWPQYYTIFLFNFLMPY